VAPRPRRRSPALCQACCEQQRTTGTMEERKKQARRRLFLTEFELVENTSRQDGEEEEAVGEVGWSVASHVCYLSNVAGDLLRSSRPVQPSIITLQAQKSAPRPLEETQPPEQSTRPPHPEAARAWRGPTAGKPGMIGCQAGVAPWVGASVVCRRPAWLDSTRFCSHPPWPKTWTVASRLSSKTISLTH